jgi:iron(III) transport system substrate-binding protein
VNIFKSIIFGISNFIFCLSVIIFGIQRANAKEINIYSYRSPALFEPFTSEYEKQFSIKFNILHAKKGLAQRLEAEGKNSPADVILTVDISRLSELADMDLVRTINSAIIDTNVPIHLRDINKKWVSLSTRARIIGISNKRVGRGAIQNIEDLANPKFKGKICTRIGSHPYNRALLASIIAHQGVRKAQLWAEALVSNFARKSKGNDRAQAKAIYSGECDIVLMNTYYFALMKFNEENPEQQKWAQATDIIFYNQNNRGQHINVSGVAIAKYSKNYNEALKFIEWLTMPKAQKIYGNVNFEYPVNPKVILSGKIMEWGTFKADDLPISKIAEFSKEAQMIIDRVGW